MTNDEQTIDLERFVDAQRETYDQALVEVRRGAKRSHWMWFVFPQITGLGLSNMSRRFAIRSLDEARSYLAHPVLGARYREIVTALQDLDTSDAVAVFGAVDAQKLGSSLTLFSVVSDEPLFASALTRWLGEPDARTLRLIELQQANQR